MILSHHQQSQVASLIKAVAKDIILPAFQNPDLHVQSKTSVHDLQTQADIDSEKALHKGLLEILPQSHVVGEENTYDNPDIMDLLFQDQKPVWVIDPIDGTRNFAQGRKEFAIMIVLAMQGEPLYAWIYDVPGDKLYFAGKGMGCFCNDQRLEPFDQTGHSNKSSDKILGYAVTSQPAKHALTQLADLGEYNVDVTSIYCAGHEYMSIIRGERIFSAYGVTYPWDHLPGILMMREMGGVCYDFSGKPFQHTNDIIDGRGKGLVSAVNDDIARMVVRFINENK